MTGEQDFYTNPTNLEEIVLASNATTEVQDEVYKNRLVGSSLVLIKSSFVLLQQHLSEEKDVKDAESIMSGPRHVLKQLETQLDDPKNHPDVCLQVALVSAGLATIHAEIMRLGGHQTEGEFPRRIGLLIARLVDLWVKLYREQLQVRKKQ